MLLAISGLGKQSLILGYNWLKDHNPKVDWKKGEVEMTRCPLRCEGGRAVMPYKRLGKISDILHLNNKNNQLERRVRPPKDIH